MFVIHEKSKNVVVGEWRRKALWIRSEGSDVEALIVLQAGLQVLISKKFGEPQKVNLETWAGEPGRSDGVGVQGDGVLPSTWKRVPLCVCGERGCGNSGKQLKLEVELEIAERILERLTEIRFAGVADQDEGDWWLGYEYMFTRKLKLDSPWTGAPPTKPAE